MRMSILKSMRYVKKGYSGKSTNTYSSIESSPSLTSKSYQRSTTYPRKQMDLSRSIQTVCLADMTISESSRLSPTIRPSKSPSGKGNQLLRAVSLNRRKRAIRGLSLSSDTPQSYRRAHERLVRAGPSQWTQTLLLLRFMALLRQKCPEEKVV